MDISALITSRRKAHRLSQEQLAQLANTSQGQISRIERGDISPSFEMAERILAAMGEKLVVDSKTRKETRRYTGNNILFNPPRYKKRKS